MLEKDLYDCQHFVDQIQDKVKDNPSLLILGLGNAEYLSKLFEVLPHLEVSVIEPDKELAQEFYKSRDFLDRNIQVYPWSCVEEVFSNLSFVSFLIKKPSVVIHPPSLKKNEAFFQEILSFRKNEKDIISLKGLDPFKDLSWCKPLKTLQEVHQEALIRKDSSILPLLKAYYYFINSHR